MPLSLSCNRDRPKLETSKCLSETVRLTAYQGSQELAVVDVDFDSHPCIYLSVFFPLSISFF